MVSMSVLKWRILGQRLDDWYPVITSNLVFLQWNQIFHDDMTAAAAIDRVVHHSVILELTVPSYQSRTPASRACEGGSPARNAAIQVLRRRAGLVSGSTPAAGS